MKLQKTFAAGILALALVLTGCQTSTSTPVETPAAKTTETSTPSTPKGTQVGSITLINPASENCEKVGGTLEMKTNNDGEYGVCYFEDNRQCEEWALFRGECPVGGVKVTGYDNDGQIYCAIIGGTVDMTNSMCTTPDGADCAIDEKGITCPDDSTPKAAS